MGFAEQNPGRDGAEHVTVAIYSFNHDSFGKTTNRAGAAGDNAAYNARDKETKLDRARQDGTAAGNAAYNAREEATYAVRSHVIPADPKAAEAWFRGQERGDRKNARMSDRFIGALPRELTPDQCIEAVEKFCRDITQDRVPWHFALHLELDKKNEPDWNPHAHIIFRDRDIETGRRYLYTSAGPKERAELTAKGIDFWTTKDFREKWSADMNHALERAGHDVRIDHRSLKEQGIDREPQIHIGPGSQNAAKKGHEFESKDRLRGERTIPYSVLDQGGRGEHNARIQAHNAANEATGHSPADKRTAEALLTVQRAWASRLHPDQHKLIEAQGEIRRGMYAGQKHDRDVLRRAHDTENAQHKAWAKKLYADARQAAFEQVKELHAGKWKDIRALQDRGLRDQAAEAVKLEQNAAYEKTSNMHVAQARIEKDQAWKAMMAAQRQERAELRTQHRDEYAALVRQQAAERLGTDEKHRAERAQLTADRIARRASMRGGMAAQQQAALQMIRLHNRLNKQSSGKAGAIHSLNTKNPAEASKAFMLLAWSENERREKIRAGLNARRQTNQLRGATPDRYRTQAGGAAAALGRGMDVDPRTQARQAAESGGTLSSEERANAPPEVRGRLDQQDRKAQTEKFTPGSQQQHRGKDRGGGGRGR